MLIRSNYKALCVSVALILTTVVFMILVELKQSVRLQEKASLCTTCIFDIPTHFDYSEKYHLYTVNGKPIIWLYHHNSNLSTWLLTSILTIHCHNVHDFHIVLVTASNIHNVLENIHPAFNLLLPAHQADYFRARILDEYGGIYSDLDVIATKSSRHLVEHLINFDHVSYSWWLENDPVSVGTLGPWRARTLVTSRWLTKMHRVLDAKLPDLSTYVYAHGIPHNITYKDAHDNRYPLNWSALLRDLLRSTFNETIFEKEEATYFAIAGHQSIGQLFNGIWRQVPHNRETDLLLKDTEWLYWFHSIMRTEKYILAAYKEPQTFNELFNVEFVFVELIAQSMHHCLNDIHAPYFIAAHSKKLRQDDEELIAMIESYAKRNGFL